MDASDFTRQVDSWVQGSAAMKASAAAGGFAVDPDSGQAYVALYERCEEQAWQLQRHIAYLTQPYRLGTSPGGRAIAPWNLRTAEQFSTACEQLFTVYANARDAYALAMRNYRATEDDAAANLRAAGE